MCICEVDFFLWYFEETFPLRLAKRIKMKYFN